MSYLTFFDAVEYLIVSSYGGASDAEQRDIRLAVQRAYSEVTTIRDWSFYQTHGRVVTQAPITGTCSFDSASNTLTQADDWPSWAAHGYIRVGTRIARISSVGGPDANLDSSITFPADFTGQSYILYRTVYPLPDDLRNMDEPSNEFYWWSGLYLTPDEAMKLERVNYRSGTPLNWTIIKDPDSYGWAIKLIGYPTKQETIDFTYRRRPRDIRYSGHEAVARAGTVSTSGSSVNITATTAFPAAASGSILRIGDTAAVPGPNESMNPFAAERKIVGLSGATVTVDSAINIPSGTKFLFTDPLDIAPHMHNAVLAGAEYWLARIRNNKPDEAFQMYQRDLRLALENETLSPTSGRSRQVWSDRGWRSPLQPDVG